MKAITAVCSTGASVPSIASGRVSRHRDGENAEIQMYISKLKDLVPFMPKNRKISKLEVITNVIQYICDLQTALDSDPAVNEFDAAAVLASQNHLLEQVSPRQPLHVRPSPNTILPSSNSNTSPTIIPASQHVYGTSNEYTSINHNVSVTQALTMTRRKDPNCPGCSLARISDAKHIHEERVFRGLAQAPISHQLMGPIEGLGPLSKFRFVAAKNFHIET
jgi:DNA-binding protein inhibitor ID, other